jgi:2,4-dienoyl-CoA reductase [(3E)-enoyl-CoA-producing], peroxisomal
MTPASPFSSNCLKGRVALVTGGGSGICFEIVRQLLLAGCEGVLICGRRETFLKEAAAILHRETGSKSAVEYQVCDVRNPDSCQDAVDFVGHRFGRLDILVNGAAGNFLAPAAEISPKGFATVMAIDALGTFNMTRAAHGLLSKTAARIEDNDTVSVINISATLQYGATWWQAHASAAKAAVDSLTRSLALEWGSDRIRVNGIAPGPIANTPGMAKLAPSLDDDDVQSMVRDRIPLGRLGESWEIGQAAVYLSVANYVTGHVLVVDGGEWLYKEPMVPRELVAELSRKVEAPSRAQAPRSNL